MFYEKGIDISNAKSMFNFLNDHFTYFTMNSWNRTKSIANNVKIYNLKLEGDCWTALNFLQREDYMTINDIISEWEANHPGYECGFNGRSGGYIVLYNKGRYSSILPDELDGYDSYEDWKADLKDYGYRVKDFMRELREYTKLVQDFDKLCDELRDYCNYLSKQDFAKNVMEEEIERFNEDYAEDLDMLNFSPLKVLEDGSVNVTELFMSKSLMEALKHYLDVTEQGYKLQTTTTAEGSFIKLED